MDNEEMKREDQGNTNNGYQDYTSESQSSYESPEEENVSKSNSVIALIMGILSLVFCCCSILGIIPGIVSIIFANKARKNGEPGGMATGGMVCAIIGIVFGILVTIFYGIYGYAVMTLINEWKSLGVYDQIQTMDQAELMEFLQNY